VLGCSSPGAPLTATGSTTAGMQTTGGSSTSASTGTSSGSTTGTSGSTSTTGSASTASTSTSGTSGTSGGTTTGGNGYLATFDELAYCSQVTVLPCRAPLVCAANGLCEFKCTTDLDCSDPQTHCAAGFCDPNPCGYAANGSLLGKGPYFACDALDAGDGTCLPNANRDTFAPNGGPQFVCVRPGTSHGLCLWPSALSTEPDTCPAGQVCDAVADLTLTPSYGALAPIGNCRRVCSPYDGGGCVAGFACSQAFPVAWGTPTCVAADGGLLPDGGLICPSGPLLPEYGDCVPDDAGGGCTCGETCRADPIFGTGGGPTVCEVACNTDRDCLTVGDQCLEGYCGPRLCGNNLFGNAWPGTLGGSCPLGGDAGNGTCVPFGPFYGVCVAPGTATAECDPNLGTRDAGGICVAGEACVLQGICAHVCDPQALDGGTGCPSGVACVAVARDVAAGACLGPCAPPNAFCRTNGDCCSSSCHPNTGCN
jgi:hypothetical protein